MQQLLTWLKPYRLPLLLLMLVISRMVIFGDARIPVGKIFRDYILTDRNESRLKIDAPTSGSSFRQGRKVVFKSHTPDQCTEIRWLSSIDGHIQKGRHIFTSTLLTVGLHEITLIANCGGTQMRTSITLSILP